MREFVAYSTLILTVGLAVSRPRVSARWQIGPATAAFGGVLFLLMTGIVEAGDVLHSFALHWQPFVTILAIMVLAATAERLGVLEALAERIFTDRKATPAQLFRRVFLLSAVTASVLNNDAMVILLTPLVIVLVKRRYPGRTRLLLPFAFAVFAAVGVAPFVVSNPMNMIVAAYAGLNFNQYTAWMLPIALAGWAVTYPVLRLLFRKELSEKVRSPPPPSRGSAALSRIQWTMIGLLGAVVATYPVVAAHDGLPIWVVALAGAVGGVALVVRGTKAGLRDLIFRYVAWDIFVFLLCIYVIAVGLRNVGLSKLLASIYTGSGIAVVGSVAAVGSAVLNNHPMSFINLMALEATPGSGQREILAALIGGDLGPRLLPVGSLAGLLWLETCRRMGVRVSLATFVRVGLALSVPALFVSLLILHLR